MKLERCAKNPILKPISEHYWESAWVFNPAAIYLEGKIHIIYRAMSWDNVSSLGYARFSSDGHTLEERTKFPIYSPRASFEARNIFSRENANVGCEDPRITLVDDRIVMCYTAASDTGEPRVALTSIKKRDFLAGKWDWKYPALISPPGIGDKNAAVIPLSGNRYVFFHRIFPGVWTHTRSSMNFKNGEYLSGNLVLRPRDGMWDSWKTGICCAPLKCQYGWLLLYHGISSENNVYRLGAAILDADNPGKIICRSINPIFEPEEDYEFSGQVPNVVFSCGAVVVDDRLLVYYGAADAVVCLAVCDVKELADGLLRGEV